MGPATTQAPTQCPKGPATTQAPTLCFEPPPPSLWRQALSYHPCPLGLITCLTVMVPAPAQALTPSLPGPRPPPLPFPVPIYDQPEVSSISTLAGRDCASRRCRLILSPFPPVPPPSSHSTFKGALPWFIYRFDRHHPSDRDILCARYAALCARYAASMRWSPPVPGGHVGPSTLFFNGLLLLFTLIAVGTASLLPLLYRRRPLSLALQPLHRFFASFLSPQV